MSAPVLRIDFSAVLGHPDNSWNRKFATLGECDTLHRRLMETGIDASRQAWKAGFLPQWVGDTLEIRLRTRRPEPRVTSEITCLAHLQPEPCPVCAAYKAAGL